MANAYEVDASELVRAAAEGLKSVIRQQPDYMHYSKSGAGRERPPSNQDFWYIRNASLMRHLYTDGPLGLSRLKKRYGGRKEHVLHRRHHVDAGGSIITDALNALEQASLVKKTAKGRELTPKGRSFLDKLSSGLSKK